MDGVDSMGKGRSLSVVKRSARTFRPFSPTPTSGETSHVRRKAATRSGMPARMAESAGERAAFSSTAMARRLAEGAGERRASMRASSFARVRICVKGTGSRSLMERLASTAGSSGYCMRIVVSRGRNRGMRVGMFASVWDQLLSASCWVG